MTPDVQPPLITRYGYSWLQHPDGLYYGPAYPGADDSLGVLEDEGVLGHSSGPGATIAISYGTPRRALGLEGGRFDHYPPR